MNRTEEMDYVSFNWCECRKTKIREVSNETGTKRKKR
jgi:hypothetical protein